MITLPKIKTISRFNLLLVLALFSGFAISAQDFVIQRVEPPFWWTGMKSNDLQLLVWGKNISQTKPEITKSGITISQFKTLESLNYLFLDLKISDNALAGSYPIVFKNGNTKVAEYDFELKLRETGSSQREGFNHADVMCLIFPDRFVNGNPENDSHPAMLEKADRKNPNGRHGGDLQGIKDKLDYIIDLGYTSVWINPVLENNQEKFTYHGYAISDFYRVDPRFGTNEEYLELSRLMHERGLKLIKDMVFNHCGSGHWWMSDLPSHDWINQFDKFTRSNFRGGTVFDPYASEYDRNLFQRGWFDSNMPDLNLDNPYLLNYLIQNSIWWIEYAGLQGIRMDTYPYPSGKAGMAQWAQKVMDEYPNFSIVGEAWLTTPAQVAVWQQGDKLKTGYESALTHVFDFPMYEAFRFAFNETPGWHTGLMRFYDLFSQDFVYQNPQDIVIFADNHDGSRIFSKVNENLNSFKLAMTFLLTTRGIPQVYYGTEILMTGKEEQGHGLMRGDFPGGWNEDERSAFTASGRTDQENEAFDHLRTLLNWRKNKPLIHDGKLIHFIPENNVYVYFRYNDNETVMVILNNNDHEQLLDNARFKEMTGPFNAGKNILDNKEFLLNNLRVPARTGLVLELH
ncbi:MAG: glycoside hydrolase family 13 protein [Bacteroidales bacterium]|nr:glycoside hydrolase family 13 protein [Bacteroidales bacterium]